MFDRTGNRQHQLQTNGGVLMRVPGDAVDLGRAVIRGSLCPASTF